jgi:hypothetical protein
MRGLRHLPLRTRRLLLGGFLVYLFGILGFQVSSHSHQYGQSDPQSHSQSHGQSHPDCQLCQITAQAYLAPAPLVCPESPAVPVGLVQAVWAPILAERFQPFSSRAPPAA